MSKIDAVITWVDGNDPSHIAKRKKYGSSNLFKSEDVASSTRFTSLGEIFWCVASINRFAPFIHRIYIVTDSQDPHLDTWMKRQFPEGYIPMEIVDHSVLFRGYEQYMPTFDSITLETLTWRIPGLSEHFIEFNDDLMLNAPLTPEDFFTADGKSVCYAVRYSMWWARFTRALIPKINGRRKVTFKGSMLNGARLAGNRFWFLKIHHTPKALLKSCYEQFFTAHPDQLIRNIRHRFRTTEQFTSQEYQYLTLKKADRLELRSIQKNLFYFRPRKKEGYADERMKKLRNRKYYKFCCFNSLDQASETDRKKIETYIEERLGVTLQ